MEEETKRDAELAEQVDYPIHSLLEAFEQNPRFPTCFANDPPLGTTPATPSPPRPWRGT